MTPIIMLRKHNWLKQRSPSTWEDDPISLFLCIRFQYETSVPWMSISRVLMFMFWVLLRVGHISCNRLSLRQIQYGIYPRLNIKKIAWLLSKADYVCVFFLNPFRYTMDFEICLKYVNKSISIQCVVKSAFTIPSNRKGFNLRLRFHFNTMIFLNLRLRFYFNTMDFATSLCVYDSI